VSNCPDPSKTAKKRQLLIHFPASKQISPIIDRSMALPNDSYFHGFRWAGKKPFTSLFPPKQADTFVFPFSEPLHAGNALY
jgi:hypothetical protein